MAELQKNQIEMLWSDMGNDRSWGSLVRVLKEYKEQERGIDESTAELLISESKRLQKSNKTFPKSAEALHETLRVKVS